MLLIVRMVGTRLCKIISWKLTLKIHFTHVIFGTDVEKSQTSKEYKHFKVLINLASFL